MKVDEIRAFVTGVMECYDSIGMTLSVVHNGEVIMAEGFGVREIETQLPVTEDTLFAIGSTSKAFTGILAAMAVGEGKLSWDAPVKDYIAEFRLHNEFADQRANTRDLLAHRVGLPRNDMQWISGLNITREESIARLRYLPHDLDFRDQFEYNNWMVFVAGYLAAKQFGQTWEEMVAERLFRPLNMSRTASGVEGALELGNVARSYGVRAEGPVALPVDVDHVITMLAPAGAIHSSAVDIAQWLKFQLNLGKTDAGEQLVPPEQFAETWARQFTASRTQQNSVTESTFPASYFFMDYGFGWASGGYRGYSTYSHAGIVFFLSSSFPQCQ